MIRVLVADDHAVVRRGLRQILTETTDIDFAGEATSPEEAMAVLRKGRFDVAVVDINLRGGSGLELLGSLRREMPGLPVLILTMYSDEQYAVRALKSGAAGFLTKESAPEELVSAVRKLASGGRYVSVELAEKLASFVAGEGERPPHEKLSNREFEVLKMIASGKTVGEIGRELSLSVKTISTHRTRILEKMQMRTNAELTTYAVRRGLVG